MDHNEKLNMDNQKNLAVNRNYKDSLFRLIFQQKKDLDIYSSVLQQLPLPQYIIFYNGTRNAPEMQVLELTDAFAKIDGKESCLNCKATLLNINYGHNSTLMDRCTQLKDYAILIHYIRENANTHISLEDAVELAINDCIRQHILEDFLVKHRAEVKSMVLSSFDQENHDRILKEAYERKGEKNLLKALVRKKLDKGLPLSEIAGMLEQDEHTITELIKELKAEKQ